MKRWIKNLLYAGVACGLAAGGGLFAYHTLGQPTALKPTRFEPELNQNGTEIVVKTYRIGDHGTSQQSASYTGTIQARYQTPLGFRVAGKIESRRVEVGMRVRKGDLLFQLDPVDYELQLRVAEAEIASAQSLVQQSKADERRMLELLSSRSVSQSDYDLSLATRDVAVARLDSAKKRLELAKNQRSYCDLIADFDGLILSISGETGQVVNVGQPVLTLMNGEEMEAVVSLPETAIADAKTQLATVRLWSHPESRIPAELRELSPLADPLSRTFDARFQLREQGLMTTAAFENRPSKDGPFFAIGMTATVELQVNAEPTIEVPLSSIANRNSELREREIEDPVTSHVGMPNKRMIVWRIDERSGQVLPVPVEVLRYGNSVAIVKGDLKSGDLVASSGVQRIDPSVRVRSWIAE
jgi:membrane fusion protein, multidrug efflux system